MTRKKIISLLLVWTLLMTSVVPLAQARASDYIAVYTAYVTASTGGVIVVTFDIDATKTYYKVGANYVALQEKVGSNPWTAVKTWSSDVTTGMLKTNTWTHAYELAYSPGVSGRQYRAIVNFYVSDSKGGYDARTLTTGAITKP